MLCRYSIGIGYNKAPIDYPLLMTNVTYTFWRWTEFRNTRKFFWLRKSSILYQWCIHIIKSIHECYDNIFWFNIISYKYQIVRIVLIAYICTSISTPRTKVLELDNLLSFIWWNNQQNTGMKNNNMKLLIF